jgi:hypothetical protein
MPATPGVSSQPTSATSTNHARSADLPLGPGRRANADFGRIFRRPLQCTKRRA